MLRSPPAPASTTRRLLVAALALAFAVGQLASTLHQAVVEHEVCAHGHLVHGDGHGHERQATPEPAAPRSVGDAQRAEAPHDHDHCGLLASTRDEELAGPSVALVGVVAPPAADGAAVASAPSPVASPVALLAQAPKTSPPSA